MHTRTTFLLFSGAIGLFLAGCAATSPTMRGQSPGGSYGNVDGSHGGVGHECPMCDSGFTAAGVPMQGVPMDCQSGMCPGQMCPPAKGCRSCRGRGCDQCLNVPFHPVHRNFHTYDVPRDLSYPQQDAPAASFQNPYYTFHGPTDFFMK